MLLIDITQTVFFLRSMLIGRNCIKFFILILSESYDPVASIRNDHLYISE